MLGGGGTIKRIAILLTVFVCVYKTIYKSAPVCDFLFFVNIYFLIAYFENSRLEDWLKKICVKGFVILTSFLFVLNLVLVYIGDYVNNDFIIRHSYYLNLRGSIFVLMDAIFVFYIFKQLPAFSSKTINTISGTCFGIFLGHQGMAYHFWYKVFAERATSPVGACIHMIAAIIVIFLTCCFLDLIRQHTIGALLKRILTSKFISEKLSTIDSFMNSMN